MMQLAWFSVLLLVGLAYSSEPHTFKLCVPHSAYKPCMKMVEQGATVGVTMSCVIARDRYECMEKIKHHEADFEALDPEDMYIASKNDNEAFSILKEIRTKEEPQAEFRYEAVAVVHKDTAIHKLQDLRGLKSCHTGIGRNVGYKIPITKLTKMGILGPLNDVNMSPRENELKSLSQFFSKACLVGKWSPDTETNQRLKAKYSNLCELCEFPEKCDYPDQNSGYEGALRCLSKAGGQIAWTKVMYVKKFFGMAYGSQPAKNTEYNPSDYAYLCPDATKVPITGPPCTWAARPWPGYMADSRISSEFAQLKEQITKLNNLGESHHADWITSVLALNNMTIAMDNKGPYHPKQYLEKAKYMDVIERDVMEPRRIVRMCVTTNAMMAKCKVMETSMYSRDIRPSMLCVKKASNEECMAAIESGDCHVMSMEPGLAAKAMREHNMMPMLAETYEETNEKEYAVAVIKKSSPFQSMADLRGKKACVGHENEAAGWIIPLYMMNKMHLISQPQCPQANVMKQFFSSVQVSDDPMTCLEKGNGDIAFVTHASLWDHTDNEESTHKLSSEDYELMCSDGGRKPIHKDGVSQAEACHMAVIPSVMMMGKRTMSAVQRDDVMHTLLSAADLYSKHPEYFKMFGNYNGQPDLIFSNAANGLQAVHDDYKPQQDFMRMLNEVPCHA